MKHQLGGPFAASQPSPSPAHCAPRMRVKDASPQHSTAQGPTCEHHKRRGLGAAQCDVIRHKCAVPPAHAGRVAQAHRTEERRPAICRMQGGRCAQVGGQGLLHPCCHAGTHMMQSNHYPPLHVHVGKPCKCRPSSAHLPGSREPAWAGTWCRCRRPLPPPATSSRG